jgi:uncharacterized protein
VSAPARSREDLARRRERRRQQIRRRRLTALGLIVVIAGGAAGAAIALSGGEPQATPAGSSTSSGDVPAATSTAETASTSTVAAEPLADGSLGAKNTRLACTLLTREEIAAQFEGQVGKPTAVWPYCQWMVGKDAWVAVWVGPKTPFERIRDRSYVLEEVSGVGDDAFFGTDRFLYFGSGAASYYVLYQRVGEYTELRGDQLIALAQSILSRPIDLSAAPEPQPEDRALLATAPTTQDPLVVYFGGDSLAAGPEWAFFTQARETGLVRTFPEYQVGTGVVRSDYFDWRRHLEGEMNARRPDVAIFMSGANDNQDYVVNGIYHPNTTAFWRKRYRRDVARIMDVLTADGRKAIWVGMPPMEDPELNAGMELVNTIVESEADKRDDVSYVDTSTLFSAPGGGFTPTLTGESGESVQVRLEDGIHLNVEGSEILGRAILEELARITDAPELAPS